MQFIIFPGFLLEYGLGVSLRVTLAHSSPPCSQMCRYSCLWTTPPCTSLSLLTWGCPCVAWRFSTNHWPLQHPASWPPQQLFDPNHYYFLFPTVPRPSTSCGTSCVWQVGVQTLVSLSLLRPLHCSITPLPLPLACEKAVYPSFNFSLSTSASICMFFSCLSSLFRPLFLLNGLRKAIHYDAVLLRSSVTSLSLMPLHSRGKFCLLHQKLKCNHSSAN